MKGAGLAWGGWRGCGGGGARDKEMRIYTLIHAYCIHFHVQKCHIYIIQFVNI